MTPTVSCPLVLTNTVEVTDDGVLGPDIEPADNVFTLTTRLECPVDLVVVKNDNVSSTQNDEAWVFEAAGLSLEPAPFALQQAQAEDCVYPGERISYTIAYVNAGLGPATRVVLTETLPEYTTFAGTGWTPAGGRVYTRAVGTIPAGGGDIAYFVVEVDGAPPDLVIENEVRVGGAEEDFYPADNVSTETLSAG